MTWGLDQDVVAPASVELVITGISIHQSVQPLSA